MQSRKPHNEPSDVTAEQGEVLVDGPDGVAVSLTPEAAEETSSRLHDAGEIAAGQRENFGVEYAENTGRGSSE